ncbi:hypothetical protein IEQ34_013097 [Dendrobium chrysotoxum]|uniref:Uncharacterized protein n=1 Tax=Dendrobium chrysotoxum TaxID=161865 RepID=A0AAV7GNB5_DENCH|nr:hypothetical protein IEQ34_013097 [Dendrobium chrysotoxum]
MFRTPLATSRAGPRSSTLLRYTKEQPQMILHRHYSFTCPCAARSYPNCYQPEQHSGKLLSTMIDAVLFHPFANEISVAILLLPKRMYLLLSFRLYWIVLAVFCSLYHFC